MKTRGTRGGILLSLDREDTAETLADVWAEHAELLSTKVMLEVTDRVPWRVIQAVSERITAAGGEVVEVRPTNLVVKTKGENVIIARTIRSGGLVESTGSVIILGDVNAGAEIVAEDDIIVIGTLRGVAHAGVNGNENAFIWAQRILSPQLRIGAALAQAGGEDGKPEGAEVAHLRDEQIVLRPWDK